MRQSILAKTAVLAVALAASGCAHIGGTMAREVAAGEVTQTPVHFTSHNRRLAGDLYLPAGYQSGDKLPAVIVTGSWTSVKEQMPATYAAKMAGKGYAALVFDFRGWGPVGRQS